MGSGAIISRSRLSHHHTPPPVRQAVVITVLHATAITAFGPLLHRQQALPDTRLLGERRVAEGRYNRVQPTHYDQEGSDESEQRPHGATRPDLLGTRYRRLY